MEWPEERVIAEAQVSAAGRKAFEEAARKEKSLRAAMEKFEADPDGFLEALGRKDKKAQLDFYRKQFARLMEDELMPPEERQRRSEMGELERYRKQDAEAKEKEETAAFEAKRQASFERFEAGVIESAKLSGLPVNAFTVDRAASVAREFIARGEEPNWRVVADVLKEEFFGGLRSTLEGVEDDDALVQLLGEKLTNRAAKRLANGVKNPTPSARKATQGLTPPPRPQKGAREVVSMDDLADRLEKIRRGGD